MNITVIENSKGNLIVLEYDKNNKLINEVRLKNVKWYGDTFGGYYKNEFIKIND